MSDDSLYIRRADRVFVFVVLVMLWHAWNDVLFSSLSGSPLRDSGVEFVYSLLLHSGIFSAFTDHLLLGVAADMCLFFLPLGGLLSGRKEIWMRLLALVYTFYVLYFNAVSGHHYHSSVLLLAVLYSLCLPRQLHEIGWKLARYYGLFFLGSAACWKIFRGNIFYADQMRQMLQTQLAANIWDHQGSLRALWFLLSDRVLQVLLISGAGLQLAFWVGFFSRRYDGILAGLFILFMGMNFMLMDIFTPELWVWLMTLTVDLRGWMNRLSFLVISWRRSS